MGAIQAIADMPRTLPVFPLAGVLLLPRTELPLNVFEPRYLRMVDDTLRGQRLIGVIQPSGQGNELCRVGCAGKITAFAEQPDGRLIISLSGIVRFAAAKEAIIDSLYRVFEVDYRPFVSDFVEPAGLGMTSREGLISVMKLWLSDMGFSINWNAMGKANDEELINSLAMLAPFDAASKQAILEAPDLLARAELLAALTQICLAKGKNGTGLQ